MKENFIARFLLREAAKINFKGTKRKYSLTQTQLCQKIRKISYGEKVIADWKFSVNGAAPTIFLKIGTDMLLDITSNLAEETTICIGI